MSKKSAKDLFLVAEEDFKDGKKLSELFEYNSR